MTDPTTPPSNLRSTVPLPEQARGGAKARKPPRWTVAFLRGLERCGEVRRAAEDAAVDFSTAYARRKAHTDFAAEWEAALAAYRERAAAESTAAQNPSTIRSSADGPPPPDKLGEELSGGARIKRVALGRWGKAKEVAFLAELVASANVRRAAKAAGVSTQAVYKRRARDLRLARAWDQAVATGRARLSAMLVAAANASLDPDDLPDPDASPLPPVTVSEAIAVARLRGPADDGAALEDHEAYKREVEEARERIMSRLDRIREKELEKYKAEGWGYDEARDHWAPPGWGRPEMMAVSDGGPRAGAAHHCPHCGGGLALSVEEAGAT